MVVDTSQTSSHWHTLYIPFERIVGGDYVLYLATSDDQGESWTRHAVSEVTVHDLVSGTRTGTIELPGLGSVGGIIERPEGGHEAWFGYTDHVTPSLLT